MNALTTPQQQPGSNLLLIPQSLDQLDFVSKLIARSDLAPKDYRGKPDNVAVAIAMGLELGVSPMQAIQGIAVINGRPCVWGDLMLALCRSHHSCEWIDERVEYAPDGSVVAAICRAKRKGGEAQERRFSIDDARRAGLLGKDGPWKSYPARMLAMRARAFCLRDLFADALRGLQSAEEQADVVEGQFIEVPQPAPAQIAAPARPEREPYPAEKFATNLPQWHAVIAAGKKTADDIIAMVQTRATLSDEQKRQIREPAQAAAEQEAA